MASKAASAQYAATCPRCSAKPKEPCRAIKSGRVTDTHIARIEANYRVKLIRVKEKEVTKTIKFITLPWNKLANGYDKLGGRAEIGDVLESGIVDIPLNKIYRLAEQDRWDSQFGGAFIDLDTKEGWALEQAGLAERETRGGHHRTDLLTDWMEANDLW